MTTKEQILALAKKHFSVHNKEIFTPQLEHLPITSFVEAFYHAARKDLKQEVERLKEQKAEAVAKMHDAANQLVEFVHGDHSKLATERDELRQQLADMTKERDAFRDLSMGEKGDSYQAIQEQLAAVQAQIVGYRGALEKIADNNSCYGPFPEANNPAWGAMAIVTAREALTLPADNSALEAMIAKAAAAGAEYAFHTTGANEGLTLSDEEIRRILLIITSKE